MSLTVQNLNLKKKKREIFLKKGDTVKGQKFENFALD